MDDTNLPARMEPVALVGAAGPVPERPEVQAGIAAAAQQQLAERAEPLPFKQEETDFLTQATAALDRVLDIAERIAAMYNELSPLLPHSGKLGQLAEIADDVAATIAALKKGRLPSQPG